MSNQFIENTLMPIIGVFGLIISEIMALLILGYLVFSIWMIIDILKKSSRNNADKVLLYILIILVVPFGSILYYFLILPTGDRFFKKTLVKHKKAIIILSLVISLIVLANSLVLFHILSS